MPEISIRSKFGDYTISFETDDELDDALSRMRDHILAVDNSVGDLRPRIQRKPKPDLELTYGFTPEGQVELFYSPAELLSSVVLALYAYHPEMVAASEVEMATGIRDVYNRVLRQTKNQRYFRTQDDLFGLSHDGVRYFMERVLPTLPSVAESDSGGNEG